MRRDYNIDEKINMLLDFFSSSEYKPMRFKDIAALLQVPKGSKHEIITDDRVRYRTPGDRVKTGMFSGTQKGFGFVIIDGEPEDIFIPENATKGAMHGDKVTVLISTEKNGKRKEGAVLQILERGMKEIVGTFQKSKNFGFVVPDNQKFNHDIFIPKEHTKGAVTGHKVVAVVTNYGDGNHNPEGKVIDIIGHMNDPG